MTESNPILRQLHEIRGPDFAAEGLTIRVSHVVHDDQQEVRFLGSMCHHILLHLIQRRTERLASLPVPGGVRPLSGPADIVMFGRPIFNEPPELEWW